MSEGERATRIAANRMWYEECYEIALRNFAPFPKARLVRGIDPRHSRQRGNREGLLPVHRHEHRRSREGRDRVPGTNCPPVPWSYWTITEWRPRDQPLAHELLVQETLLRATGGILA